MVGEGWIFMDGFVWSGLCNCLVLSMGLKPLCWHLKVCGSFGPLSVGWCGLVVSLWLVLVQFLVCWMGLLGVILHFVWCGFGFVCFVGILLFGPLRVGRVYRFLEMVGEGCRGNGPIHLLSASAAEIWFWWNPDALAWIRPGLPLLSNLAGTL